jgi:hypothetical protein
MRAVLVAVLSVTLIGCASHPRPEMSATRTPAAPKVAAKYPKPIKPQKTKVVADVKHADANHADVTHTGTAIAPPTAQFETADPIAEKAKAAIGAKLENPASAEFYNLQRAKRTLRHRTVDRVCGYVKAKGGSSEDIETMPFLYIHIVDDNREIDETYLVDGKSQGAETIHAALCK